jgi:hypothetical protein
VKLKNAAGGDTTLHPDLRVNYGVESGGCTISESDKSVLSGQVVHSYVIDAYVGSCTFSFKPIFVSTSQPSIYSQPIDVIWTIIAKNIVFTSNLAVSPLTGGAEYPFTGLIKFFFPVTICVVLIILIYSSLFECSRSAKPSRCIDFEPRCFSGYSIHFWAV